MTSSVNFDSISTPADLTKANEEVKSPLSQAIEAMGDVGFEGSMLMAMWLLNNAAEWHHEFAIDKAEGRKSVAAWAADGGKLDAALAILRTVELPGVSNNEESDNASA